MTIKKIEEVTQAPETPVRYIDEVYVDATKQTGGTVKILDVRRTREVTKAQLEIEKDSYQSQADAAQSKLDEITALEAV